jgi:hypothetical protein
MMRIARNFGFITIALLASACVQESPGYNQALTAGGVQHKTVGVNSYLWHAALDTISFLPLASADPFGGVIMSEWHDVPGRSNERVKVIIYITDRALRADAIKVVVFRQTRIGSEWQPSMPEPDTSRKIEGAILTRARELRLATMGQ